MSWSPVPEAEPGRAADGWFVASVADFPALHTDRYGAACLFDVRPDHTFPEFGFNVRVLEPGQPASLYHRESSQEAFLVLAGECLAIVEDQERMLRKGDLLYSPPGTAHVLVGAGDGPCTVVMVGTRGKAGDGLFPASEPAARFGASAERDTDDPSIAYQGVTPELKPLGRVPW